MTTKRIKSNEVRRDWADVLQFVRTGGTVVVEHYNRPVATISPYEEPAMTTTYKLTTDEGIETVEIIRNGEEVREIYTVDGDVCDNSITCDSDADEYLRRRDIELRSEGYTA
jgi:antitoxin (DNA-binding transcriptional repressor) of toxin-antitoxin stability system